MDRYDRAYWHIKFLEWLLKIAVYAPSFIWGLNTSNYIMFKIKYNVNEILKENLDRD